MKEKYMSNEKIIYMLYSFDIYQTNICLHTNILQNGKNCIG